MPAGRQACGWSPAIFIDDDFLIVKFAAFFTSIIIGFTAVVAATNDIGADQQRGRVANGKNRFTAVNSRG